MFVLRNNAWCTTKQIVQMSHFSHLSLWHLDHPPSTLHHPPPSKHPPTLHPPPTYPAPCQLSTFRPARTQQPTKLTNPGDRQQRWLIAVIQMLSQVVCGMFTQGWLITRVPPSVKYLAVGPLRASFPPERTRRTRVNAKKWLTWR